MNTVVCILSAKHDGSRFLPLRPFVRDHHGAALGAGGGGRQDAADRLHLPSRLRAGVRFQQPDLQQRLLSSLRQWGKYVWSDVELYVRTCSKFIHSKTYMP